MWKWLEQYFTFSQGEKNGILLFVFLSVAVFILPEVYLYFKPVEHVDNSKYEKEISAFIKEYDEKKRSAVSDTSENSDKEDFNPYANVALSSHFKQRDAKKIEYFDFDPNKIGITEWMKLGFSQKQAESIEK